MSKFFKAILITLSFAMLMPLSAWACTSMLVSAKASATGRPLMWKHRDCGTEDNFIERVEAKSGLLGYVALFNGGDTDLREAWMGMNDAGFAVMNTASYNLAPDTAKIKDLEGLLMSRALQTCRSVDDFEKLITNLKKPLGVQANFGVMDARGGLAYFEVSDHAYRRFNVADTETGVLIRTNYSVTGTRGEGYGYIRYFNVEDLLKDKIAAGKVAPEDLTDNVSRSFWHHLLQRDCAADTCTWVVDQDFVPRYSSSASIVIEGVNPGEPVNQMVMWTMLGYPPCSYVMPVTLSVVPRDLRPVDEGFTSPLCNRTKALKRKVFPLTFGNGSHYINMEFLRPLNSSYRKASLEVYDRIRNPQKAEAAVNPSSDAAAQPNADANKDKKKGKRSKK